MDEAELTRASELAGRFLDNVETVVHGKREEVKLVLAARGPATTAAPCYNAVVTKEWRT